MKDVELKMLDRAKSLLESGEVARVIGWKKGEFFHDPEPASFESVEELKDFVYAIETGCDKETPIEIYKDRAKQHLMLLKKKVEELHNIE